MDTVRHPAVAGLFYPVDAKALRRQLNAYLQAAQPLALRPKALIVPHAGYVYSGPVAGSAYAQLAPLRDQIHRVVLLGPAHRMAFQGLAYSTASRFGTPLGEIPVDRHALAQLHDLPQVQESDAPFAGEHCLEVQLPFLQTVLQDFSLVPLLVSEADTGQVAEVLERLWDGDETLLLVSSDLSHYLDYTTAQSLDARTSQIIEQLSPERLGYHQACGRNPIKGLLEVAKRHGLQVRTLDLRNSGDTAGSRTQVVGYGAYAFTPT